MYIQLETKTSYSLLESLIQIEHYVDNAIEKGYQTLGIMDNNALYGAYKFIKYAKLKGVRPVIGLFIEVIIKERLVPINLIALNTLGLKNIFNISTKQMTQGNQEFSVIKPLLDNIQVILPVNSNLNNYQLLNGVTNDFYIGVYCNSDFEAIFELPQAKIPLKKVNFLEPNQSEAYEIMLQIKHQTVLTVDSKLNNHDCFLPDSQFETERFIHHGFDDFETINQMVKSIDYELPKAHNLPKFSKENSEQLLSQLCFEGLKNRNIKEKKYVNRLTHELETIHSMGYDDYFLIVWDLLQFAKRNNFYMGLGRGSAVGSLVAYALEITHIDPVKNHLLFERFLNPERFSMPDIDIDMPDNVRDQFIKYVHQKYGAQFVAQITTFGTFGAKMALRDVARVFGLKMEEALSLSKALPKGQYGRKIDLNDAIKDRKFENKINQKTIYQKIYQIASLIEGLPRHTSTHAAGVVLSDVPLNEFMPLQSGSEEVYNTQFDMYDIENIGLLKMDFLGLRNLTWLQKMRDEVNRRFKKNINLLEIDFEDNAILNSFEKGNTLGIFQFEALGMREMLKRLKPKQFEDLVSATSIYRPGPSQNIESFIRRRTGKEKISYYDESIAEFLKATSGIILYQEQIMQIASRFAGFSLGKADLLRRAIGKKKQVEMQELRKEFVDGALKLGHSKEKSVEIFDLIERFANYGFNRSHAYAYASVAYQMMYFKVYYPTVFYQVLVNDLGSDKTKRELFLSDAQDNQVNIVLPDINQINLVYIGNKALDIGLIGIRNSNKALNRNIIQLRKEKRFADFDDFIVRLMQVDEKNVTEENITPLIKVGLFDKMEKNRQSLLLSLDKIIKNAKIVVATNSDGLELVKMSDLQVNRVDFDDYSENEKIQFEREYLGVQLTFGALNKLEQFLGASINQMNWLKENQEVYILGEKISIKEFKTKKTGESMARIVFQGTKGSIECVFFPNIYRESYHQLENEGPYYLVKGKVVRNDKGLEIIVQKCHGVSSEECLWLKLSQINGQTIAKIRNLLLKYNGNIPVILFDESNRKTELLTKVFVKKHPKLQNELSNLGIDNVFRKKT